MPIFSEPSKAAAPLRTAGKREFKPDFSSVGPLLKLGLTPRAAETLLWLAQGKTNADIATILGITESTVKKYVQEMFEKLGVETRGAATVRALECIGLSRLRRGAGEGNRIIPALKGAPGICQTIGCARKGCALARGQSCKLGFDSL